MDCALDEQVVDDLGDGNVFQSVAACIPIAARGLRRARRRQPGLRKRPV
jgi:hypothetical protein